MHIYVELWKARPEWLALTRAEREEYIGKVAAGMKQLAALGVESIGWGFNDPETFQAAKYDFFAVWKMPSGDAVRAFERAVRQSGWFNYFDQIDAGGELSDPSKVLARHVAM